MWLRSSVKAGSRVASYKLAIPSASACLYIYIYIYHRKHLRIDTTPLLCPQIKFRDGELHELEVSQLRHPERQAEPAAAQPVAMPVWATYTNEIEQIDNATGGVVRTWPTAQASSSALGVDKSDLYKCLKGAQNTAGGYSCCYVVSWTGSAYTGDAEERGGGGERRARSCVASSRRRPGRRAAN